MTKEKREPVRQYSMEYKAEAVKLAREIGNKQAAAELDVPYGTLMGWVSAAKIGVIDTGIGSQSPESALTLASEIQRLRAENKALAKENREMKRVNAVLEEATIFFAGSRQRSAKERE